MRAQPKGAYTSTDVLFAVWLIQVSHPVFVDMQLYRIRSVHNG